MGSVDGYTLLDCMLPCTPPPYPSREYNRRRTSLGESGLLGMTFFRELAAAAVAVVAGWCTGAEPVLPSPRWPCLDDPSPWCPRGRLPRLVASPTPRGALGWAGAPTSGGGGSGWYRWWRRRWKGWEEEEETLLLTHAGRFLARSLSITITITGFPPVGRGARALRWGWRRCCCRGADRGRVRGK